MFYDIQSRFFLDVVASYQEYVNVKESKVAGNGIDMRKGMEAATALYHFGEHLAEHIGVDFNVDLRTKINADCPDYSLLGNIVNVHKHNKINRGKPLVTASKDIREVIYIIEYMDNRGPYYHGEKGIQINLVDGTERNLLDVMTNVLNMWYKLMYEYNLVENLQTYTYNRSVIYPRNLQGGTGNIDQVATRGLGLEQAYIFEKYNYTTGKIEDQYIPPYAASLIMRNDLVKETISESVPLTEEENNIYTKLEGERKRNYLIKVAKEKGVYKKLLEKSVDEWGTDKDFFLEVRNPKNNDEKIKRKMRFSKREKLHYKRLMSYKDRQLYIIELAKKRGVYEEMIQEAKEKWGVDVRPFQDKYFIDLLYSILETLIKFIRWVSLKLK